MLNIFHSFIVLIFLLCYLKLNYSHIFELATETHKVFQVIFESPMGEMIEMADPVLRDVGHASTPQSQWKHTYSFRCFECFVFEIVSQASQLKLEGLDMTETQADEGPEIAFENNDDKWKDWEQITGSLLFKSFHLKLTMIN